MHLYPGNWMATGIRSCIKPRLPTHLAQKINVGTVYADTLGLQMTIFASNIEIINIPVKVSHLDIRVSSK